jgi:hypothetical protein
MSAITHDSETSYGELTHTGDTNFTTKLTADDTNFVGSATYVVFFHCWLTGSVTSADFAVRLAHGATPTVLAEHQMRPENTASDDGEEISWMEVFTQPGTPEDLIVQIATPDSSSHTVKMRGAGLYWARIDELGSADYDYDVDTTGGDIGDETAGYSEHGTITFTPENGGDTWLVVAATLIGTRHTTYRIIGRISRDTETEVTSAWAREPSNTYITDQALMLWYGTLTAASHTFEVQLKDNNSAPASPTQHVRTVVCAINMSKFADHSSDYTGSGVTLGTDTELESLTITPSVTQDAFVFAYADNDTGDSPARTNLRLQDDGTTITPDLYSYNSKRTKNDQDFYQLGVFRYGNFDNTEHVIDWDGTKDGGTSPSVGAQSGRRIVFWGMELDYAETVVAVPADIEWEAPPDSFSAVKITVVADEVTVETEAFPGERTPPLPPPTPPTPPVVTDEEIIRAAALEVDVGLELLDADDTFLDDISEWLQPVGSSISRANLATIHGTCRLRLSQTLMWHSHRLRPYITLTDAAGNTQTWALGVYLPETPRRVAGEFPQTYLAEGYDKLVVLNTPIGVTYSLLSGATYVTAVEELLEAAGETHYNIDQSSTLTLPSDRTWPIDEQHTFLSVINELLSAIGYRGLWVDRNGYYRSVPYVAPSLRAPIWDYDTGAIDTIMHDGAVEESDLFTVPNRWVFIRDDPTQDLPTDGAGIYTVTNAADGPGSIAERGRIITRIVRMEAANQASLETQGSALVERDRQSLIHLDWVTSPNPLHWHAETVRVTATELGLTTALFSEQAWSLAFGNARMTHRARRVVT